MSAPVNMCQACGADSIVSGVDGLQQCSDCRSIQLKSGRMSRAFALKNNTNCAEGGLKSGLRLKTDGVATAEMLESGALRADCSLAGKLAFRRMMQDARADMALPAVPDAAAQSRGTELENTGFSIGDRVKSSLRIPGSDSSEGVVVGYGNKVGEVMVKFDGSDLGMSMKIRKIEMAKERKPVSNIECNTRRRNRCHEHSHVAHSVIDTATSTESSVSVTDVFRR